VVDHRIDVGKRGGALLNGFANLLKSLTTRRFCAAMLEQVNAWTRVDHCALVRLTPDGVQLFGSDSAPGFVADGARAIVAYVDRHHRADAIRSELSAGDEVAIAVRRLRATDVADAAYRRACFDEPGIVDRLSIVARDGRGGLVSVELFRSAAAGEFGDDDAARLEAIAPILAAAGTRHVELLMHAGADADSWRLRLAATCPAMTSRELDVAADLLAGHTLREAAGRLGVAYSSVVTYCERAYSRLGVRNLRELRGRFAASAKRLQTGLAPARA
jgi:DNA-binding CsgD family transcriptional regulator